MLALTRTDAAARPFFGAQTRGSHKPVHLERRNCQKAYTAPIPDIEKAPVRGLDFWLGGKRYHTASKEEVLGVFFFLSSAAFVITDLAFLRVDAQELCAHKCSELPKALKGKRRMFLLIGK